MTFGAYYEKFYIAPVMIKLRVYLDAYARTFSHVNRQ